MKRARWRHSVSEISESNGSKKKKAVAIKKPRDDEEKTKLVLAISGAQKANEDELGK